MRIFENALSEQILEYLQISGEIPRKNLYTPFVSYSYRYYATIVKRLIEEELVEVYKFKRINHIKLTQKGTEQIKLSLNNKDILPANEKKPRNAKEKRRKALVNGAIGLCVANGIYTKETEKPRLAALYEPTIDESIEAEFKEKLSSGIFYSASEIRKAHIEARETNEIANWSRLIGVVLYKRNITYLYSVGTKLIKWLPSCEIRTIKTISTFLKQSNLISQNITFYEKPNAVICGQGMSMIAKLVTGRTWGRVAEKAGDDKYRAKLAREHINAYNLSKVFISAYYVTTSRQGAEDFKIALVLTTNTKETLCNKWFEKTNNVTRITSLPLYQGVSSKYERVICSPYIDLIELDYYRKQEEPCHFIAPQGTQESIARLIGPSLLTVRDFDGNRLNHGKYDRFGAKIEPLHKNEE